MVRDIGEILRIGKDFETPDDFINMVNNFLEEVVLEGDFFHNTKIDEDLKVVVNKIEYEMFPDISEEEKEVIPMKQQQLPLKVKAATTKVVNINAATTKVQKKDILKFIELKLKVKKVEFNWTKHQFKFISEINRWRIALKEDYMKKDITFLNERFSAFDDLIDHPDLDAIQVKKLQDYSFFIECIFHLRSIDITLLNNSISHSEKIKLMFQLNEIGNKIEKVSSDYKNLLLWFKSLLFSKIQIGMYRECDCFENYKGIEDENIDISIKDLVDKFIDKDLIEVFELSAALEYSEISNDILNSEVKDIITKSSIIKEIHEYVSIGSIDDIMVVIGKSFGKKYRLTVKYIKQYFFKFRPEDAIKYLYSILFDHLVFFEYSKQEAINYVYGINNLISIISKFFGTQKDISDIQLETLISILNKIEKQLKIVGGTFFSRYKMSELYKNIANLMYDKLSKTSNENSIAQITEIKKYINNAELYIKKAKDMMYSYKFDNYPYQCILEDSILNNGTEFGKIYSFSGFLIPFQKYSITDINVLYSEIKSIESAYRPYEIAIDLRKEYKSIIGKYESLLEDLKRTKFDYISILGIFVAIVTIVIGNIQIFSRLEDLGSALLLIGSVVGLMVIMVGSIGKFTDNSSSSSLWTLWGAGFGIIILSVGIYLISGGSWWININRLGNESGNLINAVNIVELKRSELLSGINLIDANYDNLSGLVNNHISGVNSQIDSINEKLWRIENQIDIN